MKIDRVHKFICVVKCSYFYCKKLERLSLVVVMNLVTSSAALAVYIVAFLKLISYKQVNRWCRDYFTQTEDRSRQRRSKSLSAKTGM